ncbi:MAG: deoxyribonuclease V [Chloroflexota bacterium]|nr:deoxyribonuclease V [Chloroflexota bacterium]
MHVNRLHEWAVSPAEAIRIQKDLAPTLIADAPIDLDAVRTVAGVDVSVRPDPLTSEPMSRAAVVVMRFPDLTVLEVARSAQPTPFPYIPGLLTFREAPVLLEAFAALTIEPDVFIFDGMGRAHPRRMGIAAHLGLWLDRPTIGCGKTHLIGVYDPVGVEAGSASALVDRGETIGVVLRTRTNVSPVYISVGHRAELQSAIALTLRCVTRYRLPEPIRAAHREAGRTDAL